jgi:XTP/dITP diphosphohydrolase
VTRLVLLVTSPRVASGLLSGQAWRALHAGPVFAASLDSPLAAALTAADIPVRGLESAASPEVLAATLLAAARESGIATWLMAADGDQALVVALGAATPAVELEVLHGSWDLPGARLLDVVATMDRLRSPGGCPWDAQQDHRSLGPYLLEEAYEAFQAIEDADSAGLREELGDVLLQVAFHARLAEELPAAERWSIDDVAAGLVDKMVRRHPHVFSGQVVDGVDTVIANWETIKTAERGDASALANVPLSAPALTLAATLQRKAAKAGLLVASATPEPSLQDAAERFGQQPSPAAAGQLLWVAVEAMRALDIDAEMALRARARAFRDSLST